METIITHAKEDFAPFIAQQKKWYEHNPAFEYYFHDLHKAIDYCFSSQNMQIGSIQIFENNELQAHIAIIEHTQNKIQTVFFGFFSCVNSVKVFTHLWDACITYCNNKNIHAILGPINGSTWYTNRIVTYSDLEPEFPSEPLSQPYYSKLFESINPHTIIEYHSAYRKKIDTLIQLTKPSFDALKNTRVTIQKIETLSPAIIRDIFELSESVFSENPGYIPISFEQFTLLYSTEKFSSHGLHLYLLMNDNTLIGYSGNLMHSSTLIMKTICIAKEYQDKGLGNALVYKVHVDAQQLHCTKVLYALVRKENKVKRFPMDDVHVFRNYALYEFII